MNNKILILLSLLLFIVSYIKRDNLAENMLAIGALHQAPLQSKIEQPPFSLAVNDINYHIEPLYDYEIYGLVVSYRQHDGDMGVHKLWQDHLNVADFCVVWQDNAFKAQLDRLDFFNGQFTCNISTRDMQAWDSFNIDQLSNNHLLTADEAIADTLNDVGIGDQIRIKGWLADYRVGSHSGGRKTSITRNDRGNGACETIYVNEVQILSHYTNGWRRLMVTSLIVLLLSLVWFLITPYRPHRLKPRG